jgi:hypothetical protein
MLNAVGLWLKSHYMIYHGYPGYPYHTLLTTTDRWVARPLAGHPTKGDS